MGGKSRRPKRGRLHDFPDRSNCPIFVTYESDDIAATIQYEDEFETPSRMTWFSKSKRSLSSPEIAYFANLRDDQILALFVKKSDDEGKSFYYLGLVRPEANSFEQRTMPGSNEKPVGVVKLNFYWSTRCLMRFIGI